jgi:hypothetical protein
MKGYAKSLPARVIMFLVVFVPAYLASEDHSWGALKITVAAVFVFLIFLGDVAVNLLLKAGRSGSRPGTGEKDGIGR